MKPRTRRLLHRLFFALVAVITFVTLFYAEEDWRGARAWNNLRRELTARGESFDPNDFIPPPIPDDQNLAMAPLFVRTFRYKTDPATGLFTFDRDASENNPTSRQLNNLPYGRITRNINHPGQRGTWRTGHPLDLAAWQTFYRTCEDIPHPLQPGIPAEDVLLALTSCDGLLAEVSQAAAERPQARFPINYTQRPAYGINLLHLNVVQRLLRTLRLRACARLALGQTTAARNDVELMFRLDESIDNEPILISALVRSAGVDVLLQSVWEGLRTRQWSDDDLQALQTRLRGIDLLGDFQRGMRGGERDLFQTQLLEELHDWTTARELQRTLPVVMNAPLQGTALWLWRCLPLLPRGWFAQNEALASRLMQDGLIDAVDPAAGRVNPAKVEAMARRLSDPPVTPENFLARVTSIYQDVPVSFATVQTAVGQATAACALERYALDHHGYPEHLDALVPVYLDRVPHDLIDGAALRYRLTSDGRYQLWSVGWDGKDDGGSIDWPAARGKAASFPNPEKKTGDWVWQYAPAEPPEPPAHRSRLE